jgi:hypothetical protein
VQKFPLHAAMRPSLHGVRATAFTHKSLRCV